MRNKRIIQRKQELKQLALEIRQTKKECGYGPWSESETYRFRHIAYCMARGRTYEEIEKKVHPHNVISEYRWEIINKDMAELKEGYNETVCTCA